MQCQGNPIHIPQELYFESMCFWSNNFFNSTIYVYFTLKRLAGFVFLFFYRSSSALDRRSSTQILPNYWGTFCAGVCPMSVFSFLAAGGFEPMSW